MTTGDQSPVPDFLSRLRVDGRTYVVAGAGVGMGRMTSHALAQAGAKTVVCADVEPGRAEEIAAEIGPCGVPWTGDVTTRAGATALADAAFAIDGRIDGLVDIIGMAKWESILDMTDETFDWEIDICLRHAFLLSQTVGRHMIDERRRHDGVHRLSERQDISPDARWLRCGKSRAHGLGAVTGRRTRTASDSSERDCPRNDSHASHGCGVHA